jgi:raffinose/stachyose/melibiose transport system permease protein
MTPLSLVTPSARPSNGARERRLLGGRKSFYLYIAPATLLFAAFVVYPILSVVLVSFVDRDSASLGTGAFANYQAVFADPIFWKAARNMVFWAVLTITIQMVIGGTLAYLIEQHARRSKAVLRTAFLIPMVTSASVVAIV